MNVNATKTRKKYTWIGEEVRTGAAPLRNHQKRKPGGPEKREGKSLPFDLIFPLFFPYIFPSFFLQNPDFSGLSKSVVEILDNADNSTWENSPEIGFLSGVVQVVVEPLSKKTGKNRAKNAVSTKFEGFRQRLDNGFFCYIAYYQHFNFFVVEKLLFLSNYVRRRKNIRIYIFVLL